MEHEDPTQPTQLPLFEQPGDSGHSMSECIARVIEHLGDCNWCRMIFTEICKGM